MARLKKASDLRNEPGTSVYNALTHKEQTTMSVSMIVAVASIPVISLLGLFDMNHLYIYIPSSMGLSLVISLAFVFGIIFHHDIKYKKLKLK